MRLVLASNNAGKLVELETLFAPLGFDLVPQSALGVTEAEEPHCTFVENALAKARHAAAASGFAAIADDAGICVEALGGAPGVDTAHFAERQGRPKRDNVRAVLDALRGQANRRAALVSTLVGLRHAADPEPLIAVGRAVGELIEIPAGDNGFGFDPVMFIAAEGCTFGEMTPERKNALSHRGRAARAMLALMRERWLA